MKHSDTIISFSTYSFPIKLCVVHNKYNVHSGKFHHDPFVVGLWQHEKILSQIFGIVGKHYSQTLSEFWYICLCMPRCTAAFFSLEPENFTKINGCPSAFRLQTVCRVLISYLLDRYALHVWIVIIVSR